jgi:hypothetical protein
MKEVGNKNYTELGPIHSSRKIPNPDKLEELFLDELYIMYL